MTRGRYNASFEKGYIRIKGGGGGTRCRGKIPHDQSATAFHFLMVTRGSASPPAAAAAAAGSAAMFLKKGGENTRTSGENFRRGAAIIEDREKVRN